MILKQVGRMTKPGGGFASRWRREEARAREALVIKRLVFSHPVSPATSAESTSSEKRIDRELEESGRLLNEAIARIPQAPTGGFGEIQQEQLVGREI